MPIEKNEGTCTTEPILDPEKQRRYHSDYSSDNDERLEFYIRTAVDHVSYLRAEMYRRQKEAEIEQARVTELARLGEEAAAKVRRIDALKALGLTEDDVKSIGEIKKLTEDLKKSIDTFRVQPDAWRPFEPFHPNPSYPFFPALNWSK